MANAIQGPRPYPYPRPIPPPPIPHELADPISCYKCHSPSLPLPTADSSQVYAAESYYRQVLTSTWRTHIDQVEAVNLANELEAQGLLERWVEQLLEEGLDPTKLGEKATVEESREGIKEAVRIVTSKEQMETRMERVLKRTMESVLVRMLSLGYGAFCFHDLLQSSPHQTVPTYTPLPPIPSTTSSSFSLSILRSTAANRLPTFKTRLREARLTPDDLATLLTDSYPLWRGLLIECCKREHHKSMYDVQLMMVGGFSIKLLELAWRELRIDRTRGRTVESEKKVGFARVVRWCEAGGVRIALWEKGEKERMEKERKREVERLLLEEQSRKERESKEKEERKKRERTERRRKRDQERYEEVLGRLVAIDKERRALLEESVTLETERGALENKLNPNSNHHFGNSSPATTRPSTPDSTTTSAAAEDSAPPSTPPPPPPAPSTTVDAPPPPAPAPEPTTDASAIAAASLELQKAEERVKIAQRIENVFQRMVDNPATGVEEGGKKGAKGTKAKASIVKPFVPPLVPRPSVPATQATKKEVNGLTQPVSAPEEKEASKSVPAPAPAPSSAVKEDQPVDKPSPSPAPAPVDAPISSTAAPAVYSSASDLPPLVFVAEAEKEVAPSPSPSPAFSPSPAIDSSSFPTSATDPPAEPSPAPSSGPSWAQKVATAHRTWIPPSGASVRRTAVRRLGGGGTMTQTGWEEMGLGPGGEGMEEVWGEGEFSNLSGAGMRLGEEEEEEGEKKEEEEGEFVQGCSKELEWIWRRRERERDGWWKKSRAGLEWKREKGKEREVVRELPECTCGGNWDGRDDSPAPTRRRKKTRQPRTTSTSRSTSVDTRAPADPPAVASTAAPSSTTDQPATLPHICPIDIHTPDPHAPDDWTPPTSIAPSVSSTLSAIFLAAYNTALLEVNAQQLVQLFQSSTKEAVAQVWEKGGEPGEFIGGREEERRAMESVVGEIVCVTAKKEYHDRVAKLALRVALPRVVKEVWMLLRSSLPRETRSTQPPCLCLISAQSWILQDYLNRLLSTVPSARSSTTPFPYLDPTSTSSTRSIYARLSPSPGREKVEAMVDAHAMAWDLFARRATRVNPQEFASVKHVVKLLTAQGGASVWRMATKQMAALEALEADTFSPLNAWETVVEDVGVRAEEQVFRKENETVQNKLIFEDVTAPWGSLTGLNTGHPTDPEACVFDLTVATTVRPDLPRPYLARAIARLKIDRPWHNSEILYDASMALALSPPLSPAETAVAFRVRAAAYSKQCRLKEAYQDFRRDTESKASVTATALLRNSLPGARITLPGFLRPPKSRARAGKTVCHPGRCCMPAGSTNDYNLLKPLDQPLLEAFLAAVRYDAHLSYQREIHRLITESVFGSLLFDESDIDDKDAIKDVSSYFWYRDLESYFQHTATKVFPEELRKNMESWLSTEWYQEHMQETLERAAFRLAEDWLYVGNEEQCLCTLNANPETLTRLETARVTYNSLSDAVRRPTAISSSDLASLHHDIQSELAEGKRTSEFWTRGGWEEPVNKAAAHGFDVLSKVIETEEKEGKLQWIDQYDGVVKILRHLSGVLIYQSIASAPTFSRRRKVGEVDDFSAWVAVALAGRDLKAESATLIEDMGDVFYDAEDGDRALQEYSEAIAIHRTPNALMQRVRLIKKLASTDDADEKADRAQLIVRDCSQAIVLQPTNADAFAARAEALFELEHFYDVCSDLFALHHLTPDHPTILLLAHQVDDALMGLDRAQDPDFDGVHGPLPTLYNRLRTSLTSVTPFKTSRPTPLAKRADPSFVDSDPPAADTVTKELTSAPATTTTAPAATKAAATNKEVVSRRDAAAVADVAAYNAALARQQKGAAPPKPTMPLSYYPDPRCACPPIRCSGAVPVVENFDRLDELLLEIFLMSHKIELAERRPLSFAAIRDTLLRQYILTPGWEKGDVNSPAQRTLMETLSNDLLSSGYENGTARADRGLESWLNATLLAIKSLPIHRGTANSRDCCICLLSGNLDHVQVVHSVLARKVEQLSEDPITLPRADLAALLVYCRSQIKAGTLVARGGIWRSAPKWRFEVEKLAGVFEQVFEDAVRKFNYKAFEDDYPQIAKLVGGLATFEAAHRLLLHPDPPEPGSTKRPPLAVEDVLGWAAFVSANAPYEGDGDLSKLGDVKTIGLATAKVDEATKLFRDAKYLEAIRAYSIAAIWACDRSGKETPGAERKYLRDEARRTLKSGIYAQLSYLRTLFPSNRQWMSAVADATLAIACSQKAELPAALDLRSTALHGIRHYKYALSDLEDAARLDPVKGAGWEDRLSEMRRLVPVASRIISRFSTRLDAVGHIPIDFQEPDVPKSGCPRPGCTGESCSGEDSHVTKAKDAVTRFANGTNGTSEADHEEDGEETFDNVEPSESAFEDVHPLSSYVLCPDPRLACPPHRCTGVKPTEANIDRLDGHLLDLFLVAHAYELPNSSKSSWLVHRHDWMLQFLQMPETVNGLSTGDSEWMERHTSKWLQEKFNELATPRGRVAEGWRYWLDANALVLSMLSPTGSETSDPTTSCICELSSNVDRVQAAVHNMVQKASKVQAKLPPRLATLDVPAVISHLRDRVANGNIVKQSFWASEPKWTVKAAELIMIFGACFDRVYAKLDIKAYASVMPKIARFLGGVATYSTAIRLSNWLVGPNLSELRQTSAWPAFAEEYADSYLAQGELEFVPERERASLAEEQDRKAQKSGGDEILAIRAFAIKSIWLGHLNFPLRDDDGARDDLFCTYAAVAKLRMRLAIKRQFDEAVVDFTAALGYLNSATIRLNRAEALSRIGGLDDVAAKDILEARSVGNFSGRELPAWEASLALRLKEQGHPELFELHVRTTDGSHFISNGSNGFLDVVDVPTSLEPAETSLQDVVESAVAAIDQSLSTTTAATEAVVAANSSLPDSRLACSPDRHDVGAEPSPANLNQVDTFLLDIFLQIHQQMLHKLHPGRLAETRELFLQDFVRRRSGWEKSDIETSSTMRKSMRDGIKTALGEMFTSSVLAGFGLEAIVHTLATMAVTISSHFEASSMTPCICTLTKSIPFLQKTLAELKEVTAKLPPTPAPAPTDLGAIQAHCRAQIKTAALSGGIWRSNPVWRKKIASLVTVFDQVFIEVVDNDWDGAEAARCGEYEEVARMVGGIAVWDRALRVDQEMKLGGWKIEESGAGNGGREVEAVAGWMCFVGTGGAASRYQVDGETEATRRARWTKVRDERIRLGNVELNNNEPKRALREFSVGALFVPNDPTVYVLMARARLALNDKTQFHEVIADCTLGLSRCSVPAPSLPATISERERAISAKPALSLETAVAVKKAKATAPSDPTAYTRADLLLLRAKALVAVERFGLALYDLEALSSSLRREHTAEADAMIQSIKTWISQEQRGLEELRKEASDAAEHLQGHCHCCDAESGESGAGGEEELGEEAEDGAEAQA